MAPCPHPHAVTRCLDVDIAAGLEVGRRRCEAAGQAWTPPRRRTYELLLTEPRPLKAYELLARYRPDGGLTKPPTVYRSLDVLMAVGLVHKVEALSAFTACYGGCAPRELGLLICDCCGRVDEVSAALGAEAGASASVRAFQVESVRLEMIGRCGECREIPQNAAD